MVKLVTVATHSDSYFPWLQESCKRYNTKLDILGWDQKWQGYTWRFSLMIEYLKNIPPDELVCFIDAYDVLLLRPVEEIQAYYDNINKVSNKKIIIGVELFNEKNPAPFFNKYYFSTCDNNFICAGIYIGKAKDLLNIISNVKGNNKNDDDDQMILTKYCNNHSDIFYIDINNTLIINAGPHYNIDNNTNITVDNNYSLSFNNFKPFFFHGPGNSELFNLLKKLNYNISSEQIEEIKLKTKIIKDKKHIYYNTQLFYKYYLLIILIIIIIFISIIYYYRKK